MTIMLDRAIWSIDSASADRLLDGPARLELDIAEAVTEDGPTLAAAIGYGIGLDLEELYGLGAMAAVSLVAVSLDTGLFFVRRMADPHALPLAETLPETLPEPEDAEESDENTAAERAGVDLNRYLGLPLDGGKFALFAWLDGLVSPTVVVDMPETKGARHGTPAEFSLLPMRMQPLSATPEGLLIESTGSALCVKGQEGRPVVVLAHDTERHHFYAASGFAKPESEFIADLTPMAAVASETPYPAWAVAFNGEIARHPVQF